MPSLSFWDQRLNQIIRWQSLFWDIPHFIITLTFSIDCIIWVIVVQFSSLLEVIFSCYFTLIISAVRWQGPVAPVHVLSFFLCSMPPSFLGLVSKSGLHAFLARPSTEALLAARPLHSHRDHNSLLCKGFVYPTRVMRSICLSCLCAFFPLLFAPPPFSFPSPLSLPIVAGIGGPTD